MNIQKPLISTILLAGILLMVSGTGVYQAAVSSATGQGSTILRPAEAGVPGLFPAPHYAAAELTYPGTGQFALGALLFLLGFGLHAYMVTHRKPSARAEDEREVPVRKTKNGRFVKTPEGERWFLWMNVRM